MFFFWMAIIAIGVPTVILIGVKVALNATGWYVRARIWVSNKIQAYRKRQKVNTGW